MEKQYTKKVVVNIINFMAQAGVGIKPSKEEIEQIPEEFHKDIMASLMAAQQVKKLALMAKLSSSPLGDMIKEAMSEKD